MRFALAIPDPTRSPVPKGWAEQVFTDLQVVEDIEDLDTGRASLQGYVAAWKSKGYQTAELQSGRYATSRESTGTRTSSLTTSANPRASIASASGVRPRRW